MRKNFHTTVSAAFLIGALAIPLARGAVAAERVYVPLGSSNEIVVIDPDSDTVIGHIKGITAVHGLAATPDGRYLVAGSYSERESGALPPKPNSVSAEDHAAHHAQPAATSKPRSGELAGTVTIIRVSDKQILRGVDVPGAVHHVAIDPKGRFAVVTHPNGGTITAIDLELFNVLATIKTGVLPNYAVFDNKARRLFVTNAGDGSVAEVDTTTWRVTRVMAVGNAPEHVVLSPDGRTLFVNNVDDGLVAVLDIESGQIVKTLPVGDTPHGVAISDDGKRLFASAMGDNKVVAIDIATGTARNMRLAPAPYHVAFLRARDKVYVSSADDPKIWVLNQMDLVVVGEISIGGKGHQLVQIGAR